VQYGAMQILSILRIKLNINKPRVSIKSLTIFLITILIKCDK
jgi:hypothetical protein